MHFRSTRHQIMGPPQAKAVIYEAFAYWVVTKVSSSPTASLEERYTCDQLHHLTGHQTLGHYDIILAGRQAIDGDTAQVGPQIAEQLDLPQITYVEHSRLWMATRPLTVKKKTSKRETSILR